MFLGEEKECDGLLTVVGVGRRQYPRLEITTVFHGLRNVPLAFIDLFVPEESYSCLVANKMNSNISDEVKVSRPSTQT